MLLYDIKYYDIKLCAVSDITWCYTSDTNDMISFTLSGAISVISAVSNDAITVI